MKIITSLKPPRPSGTPPLKRRGIYPALTVLLSYVLTVSVSYGQISTCEKPVSFTREIPAMRINEKSQKIMPFLDMNKIEMEDAEDNLNGVPPRFGFPHETEFTLENSGEWIELPEGDKIWRLQIYCPNATSINLLYDRFWLPEGAKFFIYSNNHREQLGAFTSKNNKGKKEDMRGFATGLILGNNITLEYYLPKEADDMGIVSVSRVVHGYRFFRMPDDSGRGFGDSWIGHININCPDGATWQKEKNGVVMILVDGTRQCTGALVNTTAKESDTHHYILTAEHCLSNTGYGGNVPLVLDTWSFYWHYESPRCTLLTNEPEPPRISTVGATAVAKHGGLSTIDFALLTLHDDPAEQWDVMPYYLGWDHSCNQLTGTGIHHPAGDIKKIFTNYTFDTDYNNTQLWRFSITHEKFIEGGSSGAPFLNSNHKLIGHILGKSGPFISTLDYHTKYWFVYFGKFCTAWGGMVNNPGPGNRLKDWLDPLNTGDIILDGRGECQKNIWLSLLITNGTTKNYHAVQKIISKQKIQNGATASYKAGTEIQLIDGFQARSGSTFHAKIEALAGCGGTQSVSVSPPENEQNSDSVMENTNSLLFHNLTSSKVNLLPNPNSGTFQMGTNFPLTDIANIKVINMLGVTVYETQNLTSNTIQLPNTASGQHFVMVMLKDGTVLTQKMMVQR